MTQKKPPLALGSGVRAANEGAFDPIILLVADRVPFRRCSKCMFTSTNRTVQPALAKPNQATTASTLFTSNRPLPPSPSSVVLATSSPANLRSSSAFNRAWNRRTS
jgi:hypothetical protein